MAISVEVNSLQILRGCIVIEGVVVARGEVRLGLTLDAEPLDAKVDWLSEQRWPTMSRLTAPLRPADGRPFLLRAMAGREVDAAASPRLAVTVTTSRETTSVTDLLGPWLKTSLGPAVDALYGRFIREVAERPGARILELGSRARSGHERRSHFPGADHVGFDIKPGPAVDVVGDAHALSGHFEPQSFDFATSVSVFEHLAWPWKAVLELERVLKPGAVVYTQSHQTWPVHDAPWDFFRFSKSAWSALFNETTGYEVVEAAEIMPARIVPLHQTGDPAIAVEGETGYLLSACLARKIGPAKVVWDAVPDLTSTLEDYPA